MAQQIGAYTHSVSRGFPAVHADSDLLREQVNRDDSALRVRPNDRII
jgi:hypothetical protein